MEDADELPLYADIPDLCSEQFVAGLIQDLGIAPAAGFDLAAHAARLRSSIRTAVTLGDGRAGSDLRKWQRDVAKGAKHLRQLLEEVTVTGWSAFLVDDVLSAQAGEIDESIARLPDGLALLARAAEAASAIPNDGGRPSDDAMRSQLFIDLAREFEALTGRPVKARIAGIKPDPDALAMKWTRVILKHAASCYAAADDDAFRSKDQAQRLDRIWRLSDASLLDLVEKGRADQAAGLK